MNLTWEVRTRCLQSHRTSSSILEHISGDARFLHTQIRAILSVWISTGVTSSYLTISFSSAGSFCLSVPEILEAVTLPMIWMCWSVWLQELITVGYGKLSRFHSVKGPNHTDMKYSDTLDWKHLRKNQNLIALLRPIKLSSAVHLDMY